jgi:hypothetical protein
LAIDTPPIDLNIIELAVIKSDVVVIPVRTGYLNVDAATPMAEMCREHHRA